MKTLVCARHSHGPHENGFDECYGRWATGGMCPGVYTADWLNGLGDDEEPYGLLGRVTNGDVRDNWIAGSAHIVPADRQQATLSMEERALRRRLGVVRRRLTEVRKAVQT